MMSLRGGMPALMEAPADLTEELFTFSFGVVTSILAYYLTGLIPLLITRREREVELNEEVEGFIERAKELMDGAGLIFRTEEGEFFKCHEDMRKVNNEKGIQCYGYVKDGNKTSLGHKLKRIRVLRAELIVKKNSSKYADLAGGSASKKISRVTKSPLFHPNNNYLKKSEADLADCEIEVWKSLLAYRKEINNVKTNI